jgi:hypothetical protein
MQMIQANNGSSQSGSFRVTIQNFFNNGAVFSFARCRKSGSRNFSKYARLSETNCQSRRWSFFASNYVSFGYANAVENAKKFKDEYPASTISISKVKGADAMKISEQILEKVEQLKKTIIPNDVHVEVTRNYGETASHKVSELLMHLGVAILAVTVLVMLAMGWRGGLSCFSLFH